MYSDPVFPGNLTTLPGTPSSLSGNLTRLRYAYTASGTDLPIGKMLDDKKDFAKMAEALRDVGFPLVLALTIS